MGGGEDAFNGIDNAGLIQTAFNAGSDESASFRVGDFYNGGYYDPNYGEDGGMVGHPGLISMIDGAAGDFVDIDVYYDRSDVSGNQGFHGSYDGYLTSFVGMDVAFNGGYGNSYSDFLTVYGNIDGTTGLIFNTASSGTDAVGEYIRVAYIDGYDNNNEDARCFYEACRAGDTLYISDRSMNYQEVDGIGSIQDGLYSWYLVEAEGSLVQSAMALEIPEVPNDGYYLVSTFSANAVQLPSLISGAQNIWHDTAGVVADHIYGNHFPMEGQGGGGADFLVGDVPADPVTAPNVTLWGKAAGSWTQQDGTVTETIEEVPVDIDTSFVQTTFSLLAGADYSSNPGGDGFRGGVFGGVVGSNLDFDSYDASASYSGGTIGAYGAVTFDGFYADAEVKADFLSVDYTALTVDTSANLTTAGILANAGYRAELGGFFLEPNGTVSYTTTSIDDISSGGASVVFSTGESLRAGVGVKIGTTVETEEMTTELTASAKIWNEFADANQITITDGDGNSATFSDDISGVFAELRATATAYTDDRTLSVFATAGTKFNDSFTTLDAKVGVRKGF